MKKFLCLLTVLAVLLSFAACGKDEDEKEKKTDEELITERIENFLEAYNSGDMEDVIACMDRKSGNELRAAFNVLGALGGEILGVDLNLSDLFSLGVGMSDDDYMKLQISNIQINGTTAVATTKTSLYPSDNSEIIYFILIYENDGWYINDMTDDKPEGVTDENVNIEESIDSVDKSFLSETTASEGLIYELSSDKTYYILTNFGNCDDDHIVIPEYPIEYNQLPIKEIKCNFKNCSYITIPRSVERIYDTIPDNVVAINYLGDLADFCNIKFTMDAFNGNDLDRFKDKTIFLNGVALAGDIVIPSTVTSVSDNLFSGYDKITSVKVVGDTDIGTRAFYGCSSLTDVTVSSASNIGLCAFSNCSSLSRVTLNGSVSVDAYAFSECEKLSTIELGDSIRAIYSSAFENTGYYQDSSNWDKGALYIGKYLYAIKPDMINLTVKDGTLAIVDSAFRNHKNITTVLS